MKRNTLSASSIIGIGLIIAAVIGLIAIVWYGLSQISSKPAEVDETPTTVVEPATEKETEPTLPPPQVEEVEPPVEPATQVPTVTAEPTAEPTQASPTETPVPERTDPHLIAGADGVNVRTGPGVEYPKVGFLKSGEEAPIIGKYISWWQVTYNGSPAWVYGPIVVANNVDAIPQVQPPPAPTPEATAVPPTVTPAPTPDFRGLVPNGYLVEGAPGPYGVGQAIWFNWDISTVGTDISYAALGTWVAETGQFQKSWSNETSVPQTWRDHIDITSAGTYHLYLRICFHDGYCANMLGPVQVIVQ
ncbi:MAG: SH3 domain-containing protein [Chloroflexota bacterium]